MSVPQTGREFGCAACELCSLFGATSDAGVMCERVEDIAVLWTNGQCGGDFRLKIAIL